MPHRVESNADEGCGEQVERETESIAGGRIRCGVDEGIGGSHNRDKKGKSHRC